MYFHNVQRYFIDFNTMIIIEEVLYFVNFGIILYIMYAF
jgi:hypothetical protein